MVAKGAGFVLISRGPRLGTIGLTRVNPWLVEH